MSAPTSPPEAPMSAAAPATNENDEKISGQEYTTATATNNQLGRQASAAYQQTEFTTNPLTATPNNFTFNASA